MNVCIWLRIPKTASTSLHERLMSSGARSVDGCPLDVVELPRAMVLTAGHMTPGMLVDRGVLKEPTIRRAFCFSVVRNPWARMASLFFGIGSDYRWTDNFERFVLQSIADRSRTASAEGTPISTPMEDWLRLGDLPVCEMVLRMERLDDDYPALAARLGLDPEPLALQNVHSHPPYTEIYTPAAIEAVARNDRYVIERYGYRYGDDTKSEFMEAGQ